MIGSRGALSFAVVAMCASAMAEPLPSGAIGVVTGGVAGTGADAARVGAGFYAFGAQASWQPTTTSAHIGWTVRWSTLFGILWGGNAARIDPSLRTVQIDFTLGMRARPWASTTRYLTVRGGMELLRSNDPIASDPTSIAFGNRDFIGPIASVGLDQYIAGMLMLDIDVRYGMIAVGGPATIALLVGIGFAGP